MPKAPDEKTLRHWIDTCRDMGRDLTEWEEEFLSNVDGQLSQNGGLSPRQIEIIERIYAEKTP